MLGPPEDGTRPGAGMAFVVDHLDSVDKNGPDTGWEAMGLGESGRIGDGCGVENDQIGLFARRQTAAVVESDLVGGHTGHFFDGKGK